MSGELITVKDAFHWNRALEKGLNLGNSLEVVEQDKWKIDYKPEHIKMIAEAGFSSVRIPIRWSVHSQLSPPYEVDPEIFDKVDALIEQAFEQGLTVIINVHHFRELMTSPSEHTERFLAIWEQIAGHYAKYPPELYFELLNEPSKQLWANVWNSVLLDALAIVRRDNPKRAVLIGPARFNSIEQLAHLKLPTDDNNIIASFHFYKPLNFTHQGANWVYGYSSEWEGNQWTGTSQQKEAITQQLDMATQWADANNLPLNMGEFGVYWRADMTSRAEWTQFVRSEAEKRGISWTYWSFGAGFGVYDVAGERWRVGLLNALLPTE